MTNTSAKMVTILLASLFGTVACAPKVSETAPAVNEKTPLANNAPVASEKTPLANNAAVASEKAPVAISQLADKITVNGDAAKWAKIQALPAPFAKKEAGSVKLAWSEEGLFGIAQIKDDKIVIDDTTPWSGDCIELFIETDAARADELGTNGMQLVLAPNPTAGAGKAVVVVAQGTAAPNQITAMWKPVDGGYTLEFFIPAKALRPAKMAAETKMSFNYSVDNDGKPVEQFFSDKDADDGYKAPKNWGMIQFAK